MFLIQAFEFFQSIFKILPKDGDTLLLKIVKWLLIVFLLWAILSGFIYWRITNITKLTPGLEAWSIALDVSLAQIIVLWPFFVISIHVAKFFVRIYWAVLDKLATVIYYFLGLEVLENREKAKKEPEKQKLYNLLKGVVFISLLSGVALIVYGVFLINRIILIDTLDFQELLFRGFDHSLGFEYPTTFRFTFLYKTVNQYFLTITKNSVLSTIIGFWVILFTSLGVVAGIIKSISYLEEGINKSKHSNRYR